jgi:CO/xanthine dehydrogenase Mo-binding subunit
MPPMYSTPTGIRSRSYIRASVKAVIADVGTPVNPLTLEAQFQGGIFGLSQLMANGAFSAGRVGQRNFDRYTPRT